MKFLNNKGVSLIEAIASIVIISFVMAASFTIIVNIRNQTFASNEKINAIEIGTGIRDDLVNTIVYNDLVNWLDSDKVITSDNCTASLAPFACDLFNATLDNKSYTNLIEIVFTTPTASDLEYGIVNFTIRINYYSNRWIELVGVVYE